MNRENTMQAWNYYNEHGVTLEKVGIHFGKHQQSISRDFRRFKLKTRNLSESCNLRYNFNYLTMAERGYIAGIIDGEGCITNNNVIHITNTDLEMLLWIKSKIKYGYISARKKEKQHYKQCYDYQLSKCITKALLKVLKPHLIIKKDKCKNL